MNRPKVFFTNILLSPSSTESLNDADLELVGRFFVLLYDRASPCIDVNQCWRVLFAKKQINAELVPPIKDEIKQHVLRGNYLSPPTTKSTACDFKYAQIILIMVCEFLMRKFSILHGVKIMLSEFYMDKKGRRPYITFYKSEIRFL